MHFVGVFNRDGGTFRTLDMAAFCTRAEAIFAERGHSLTCRAVAGAQLVAALEEVAAEPGVDVLLAGGGDGTISAAATVCFHHKMPLAILPAGTMNMFARALRMPLELEPALIAIAEGALVPADIATANGRPFVYQYSVGMHSRLVRLRDGMSYRSRLGKIAASARAMIDAFSRPLQFDVDIVTADGEEHRPAMAISVSNNPLVPGPVLFAGSTDRGVLGVLVASPMPVTEALRLGLAALFFRQWQPHALFSASEVTHVTLRFRRRKAKDYAVVDGELVPLPREVDLEIHPGGLEVLVPRAVTPAAAP
jgi:diacylglycerol kinase family enzyme